MCRQMWVAGDIHEAVGATQVEIKVHLAEEERSDARAKLARHTAKLLKVLPYMSWFPYITAGRWYSWQAGRDSAFISQLPHQIRYNNNTRHMWCPTKPASPSQQKLFQAFVFQLDQDVVQKLSREIQK
jgi:hypothetical protein